MNYLEMVLPGSDGLDHQLKDYHGKKVVLYFYPKDNTSGCTLEAKEFTRLKNEYETLGYTIIGVSKDSVKSHQNFIKKQELDLLLLSDENLQLITAFDVYKEKSMYGKKYMGVERSTFLLDESGKVSASFRSVNASKHPETLLCELK